MSELTDDQLDGLFRKSAEEYEAPFESASWRDMETRLDADDRTRTGAWFWKKLLRWGIPVLLLLLVAGSIWVYRFVDADKTSLHKNATSETLRSPKTRQSERAIETPVTNATSSKVASAEPNRDDVNTKRADSDEAIATLPLERKTTPKRAEKSKTITTFATNRTKSAYRDLSKRVPLKTIRPTLSDNHTSTNPSTTKRGNVVTRNSDFAQHNRSPERYASVFNPTANATNATLLSEQQPAQGRQENRQGSKASEPNTAAPYTESTNELSKTLRIAALRSLAAKWPKSVAFTKRDVALKPDTTARTVVPKLPSEHGLSVRAVVSPDLSTIGLKNFSRPGTNLGLLLEYRFASRWSVQAGVLQSTKVYRALPSEYKPPYGTWGGSKRPESVDGRCDMLDIPINLRYDVVLRAKDGRIKSRWFVSGGTTTYVMNQEYYRYNYPSHTYNQIVDTTTSTGIYGFSHLNVSVGYERALSRRLSWQVEPFIKMPVQQVGFFLINLLSTGVFFSLRYKLY